MSKSNRYHPNIKEIIALNDLAVEYYENKDFQKAHKACVKIYELEPAPDILRQSVDLGTHHMRYHMILGETYYRNGNLPEAIKILNRLKSLGKHFSNKYIVLAKIHLKNGDYTKALQEYEEMTVECPQRFKSILNGLLDIINLNPFIERSYKLLHNLYRKRGKEESLIPDFKRKIEKDVNNRQCLLNVLEHLYYLSGQTSQAIPLLIKHQEKYPKDPNPSYLLGNIFLESCKYSEAIIQYNKVTELAPSRKTDIISSIEKILVNKEADKNIINYLIDFYIDTGNLEQAEIRIDHLLKMEPDNTNYQNKMEQVLTRLIPSSFHDNLLDFCISKSEKLIELRPKDTRYKKMLNDIRNLNTRRKIIEYENKLKDDNLNKDEEDRLNFDLAMLYTYAGTNEERTISLLQNVANSNSSRKVEALLRLGMSFLDKGHNDYAFNNFNKISALYVPTREKLQLFYQIAVACEKKNLLDKAKYYYGKILSIDLQYKDVPKRLSTISSLTKSAKGETLMTNLNQRFENIMKIGEDNIWVFYKAVDKSLKRKVVINVIKDDFSHNQGAIERFITEIQSISKFQHNGIVKVYDVSIDSLFYIVMEYIDGESLMSIKKKKRFSWQEVLKIAIDVCDAIKCAHKHGIIHGNLNPNHIRLTKGNTVKITGFGLTHITNITIVNKTNQKNEMTFYASPEQIRGTEEEIDERSDIYSLGITLYELLTGHLPFHEGDIADKHVNEPPESLSKGNPEIPKWLDKMILQCLEKNPSDRYQEIGYLQKSLESYSKFYLD
ncbi:MAG: protein kinase [Candidatus Brocadiales bacterium]|nr:protein kinase [Candidatus Brocadiales bacterium]